MLKYRNKYFHICTGINPANIPTGNGGDKEYTEQIHFSSLNLTSNCNWQLNGLADRRNIKL